MRTTRHLRATVVQILRVERTRRIVILGLALATLALSAPWAAASNRELGSDGILHSISVENRTGGGTRLVHQAQKADGTVASLVIPGTDDPIPDVDPAISVCP